MKIFKCDNERRPAILFFFSKNVFQPYERARRVGHESRSLRSQKLTPDFLKIISLFIDYVCVYHLIPVLV